MKVDPVQRRKLLAKIQEASTEPLVNTTDFHKKREELTARFSGLTIERTQEEHNEAVRLKNSEAYATLTSELNALLDALQPAQTSSTKAASSEEGININLDVAFLKALLAFFKADQESFYDNRGVFKYSYDVNFWEWVNLDLCLKFVALRWLLNKSQLNEKTYTGSLSNYLTGYTRNYTFSLWRMFLFCQDPQVDPIGKLESHDDALRRLKIYGRDGMQAFVERVNTSYDVGFAERLNQKIIYEYDQRLRKKKQKLDTKFVRLLTKLHTAYLAPDEEGKRQLVPEAFSGSLNVENNMDKYVIFLLDQAETLSQPTAKS
jgi:hypothetical protein